jgi:hypothetical protein
MEEIDDLAEEIFEWIRNLDAVDAEVCAEGLRVTVKFPYDAVSLPHFLKKDGISATNGAILRAFALLRNEKELVLRGNRASFMLTEQMLDSEIQELIGRVRRFAPELVRDLVLAHRQWRKQNGRKVAI